MSTIYSNEKYSIATPTENLKSGKYFGTATNNSMAFDDNLLITPEDTNSECSIGIEFKEYHVGMISQVKYFIRGIMQKKDKLVDVTKF